MVETVLTATDRVLTRWLMVPDAPDLNAWFAELTRRPTWHSLAACRGSGADTFIVHRGSNAAVVARARAICATCSVRPECLDYAMADPDAVGVWGGSTGTERRQLRRDMTMTPTGAEAIAK